MIDGPEKLRAVLRQLDVRGRVVFVHSSWRVLREAVDSLPAAVDLLLESVGENGTLVMPTFPMDGLSQTHLDEHPFFDCRHTPSKSGALTEVFRQTAGVHRSVHPTHPVAACGRQAIELTEGHERSSTPFDRNSPFHRMYEAGAVGLNLGVSLSSFRHLADHLLQDELPHEVYSDRVTRVRIIDCNGVESHMDTRGHNPYIDCAFKVILDRMSRRGGRRWLRPLRWILLRGAITDRRKVGGLRVEWFPIRPYVAMHHRCYRSGRLKYFPRGGGNG